MGKDKINPVRGMHDILPEDMQRHKHVSDTACEVARLYGFDHIATPIVEFSEVFKRSLGDSSDVVNKEMYLFHDRKDRELVLRPENTASVVRALISNGLQNQLPARFFYSGPMFRYERPQKGRQRQFHQIGIEMLGTSSDFINDSEIIACGYDLLRRLGLSKHVKLHINTLGSFDDRAKYKEKLIQYLSEYRGELSEDSQMRLTKNPLRILDSKDERDKEILKHAPALQDSLSKESMNRYENVKKTLKYIGIESTHDNNLVRGLDYYCHTVFEFITDDLGAQGTVLAGGRYDGLVEAMGGTNVTGIGWAAGIERLALMLKNLEPTKEREAPVIIAVASTPEQESNKEEDGVVIQSKGLKLTNCLREENIKAKIFYYDKIGKIFQVVDRYNIPYVIILENEKVKIKNMKSREEFELNFSNNFACENAIGDKKLASIIATALQKFYGQKS